MRWPPTELDAQIEDVAGLLVDDFFRQAEARHLRAHEAARFRIGLEHGDVVAERREIACDGQRRGTRADAGDALAVLRGRRLRHARAHVALVVGGDALEPADRDRLRLLAHRSRTVVLFHASAPARRFAGPIAGAAEDPREHVAVPVDHVGIGVAAGGDQADVLGNRRVRGTGPLAVDDLVEDVGIANIGRLHYDPRCWLAGRAGRRLRVESSPVGRGASGGQARISLFRLLGFGFQGFMNHRFASRPEGSSTMSTGTWMCAVFRSSHGWRVGKSP